MNRDHVRPEGWQRESVENYGIPADPRERKQFEKEQQAKFAAQQREAVQAAPQQGRALEQNLTTGTEIVYLVNNKARPIHIGDEDIIIDGQLAVSARGPFIQLSREKLDQSFQLQSFMDRPLSNTNPHLRGVMQVEEISREEYKKRFSEYQKKKSLRQTEYAREASNVNHMGDGTIDEFDASQEVRRINPKIIRAQG